MLKTLLLICSACVSMALLGQPLLDTLDPDLDAAGERLSQLDTRALEARLERADEQLGTELRGLEQRLERRIDALEAVLDPQRLGLHDADLLQLRGLRSERLLQQHPDVVELDPLDWPIMRAQIMALAPDEAALALAQQQGFSILRRETLAGLDTELVILLAPDSLSTAAALRQLRQLDPDGTYDYHHLYLRAASPTNATPANATTRQDTADAPSPVAADRLPADRPVRVGMIDTGIDRSHQALSRLPLQTHTDCEDDAPDAHGTAVASLIAGQQGPFRGAAPNAELYAVNVYCTGSPSGQLAQIVGGLSWLAEQSIPVINISLVGADNRLLAQIVAQLSERGHLLVAAVGNDGPNAPPLYPAAYETVVGVTAVDAQNEVLLEAVRGPQVELAAPGADMAAAGLNGQFVAVRGTSFAAPIVAGLLANQLPAPNADAAAAARRQLRRQAGSKHKPDAGYGLVGTQVRISPAVANLTLQE